MNEPERRCEICNRLLDRPTDGKPISGKAKYCPGICRQKAEKARQAARWRENREKLLEQRRQSYAQSDKTAHAERMREYMRQYRAKKKAK